MRPFDRWLWTCCAAAPMVAGCSAPEGDLGPRIETAAAVVIECVDQQDGTAQQDQTAYTEKRVFLEAQGWWGEKVTGMPIPTHGDAEHLHVAMCFPIHQNVKGVLPFRVRVLGHNLPVGSTIQNTLLHDPGGASFATIQWDT